MSHYSSQDDYCSSASNSQSVLNEDATRNKLIEQNKPCSLDDVEQDRLNTKYSCSDAYQMGTIQDNQIYIATTDGQHDQIVRGEHASAQGGLSGYFSDQATVDASKNGETLDNTKYNEMCQIAPYRPEGVNGEGDASYKPHVDCFEINRTALMDNYGTNDFNAAIAKCEANNQFGSGGGNQGYNPHLSAMIDNGTLKHVPEKSYSDTSISHSTHNNPNALVNSVVPEERADKMLGDAQTRAQDCVNNNTPHPSSEACNNGFAHNPNPIESTTGNATISQNNSEQIAGHHPKEPVQQNNPAPESGGRLPDAPQKQVGNPETQIAGTTPDRKQDLNTDAVKTNPAVENNLSNDANKGTGNGISSAAGIT